MKLVDEIRLELNLLDRLRALMERYAIEQQRLAEELDVNRVTVSRWLTGERTPRGEQRRRIAELVVELESLEPDAR